jgi:serine/threonine protein kinase
LLEHVLLRGVLAEAEARPLVRQLASAVDHLHACEVVHLDIKLENIFLDVHGRVKLGDFGLAAVLPAGGLTRKFCGSGVYAAPEVLLTKELGAYDGRAADMWSVGVCIFVMVRGRFPMHQKHQLRGYAAYNEAARIAVNAGLPPINPPHALSSEQQRAAFSPQLMALLDTCICFEPAHRPSAAELSFCTWLLHADDGTPSEAACHTPTVEAKAAHADAARATSCPRTPSPITADPPRHLTPRRDQKRAASCDTVASETTQTSATSSEQASPCASRKRLRSCQQAWRPQTRASAKKQRV